MLVRGNENPQVILRISTAVRGLSWPNFPISRYSWMLESENMVVSLDRGTPI